MTAVRVWAAAVLLAVSRPEASHRPLTEPSKVDSGEILGIVRWKGDVPERKPLRGALSVAYCKEKHKDKAPLEERWVFGRNGEDATLADVLVYVSKGLEGKRFDPPKEPAVLDQIDCMYVPHVLAVMAGQPVKIKNSDDTLHNVMMANPRANPAFNIGMASRGGELERVFSEAELGINLKCVLHPWMSAYIHVLEHPFFAVTRADGTFALRGLPPGEYEISAHHETLSLVPEPRTLTVTLAAGESRKMGFAFHLVK